MVLRQIYYISGGVICFGDVSLVLTGLEGVQVLMILRVQGF